MKAIVGRRTSAILVIAASFLFLALAQQSARTQNPAAQDPAQKEKRGIGIQAASPSPTAVSNASQTNSVAKPEIVLQAGITSPQTEIRFSPDGRLLASMGIGGNAIKLWDVASGQLLRQLESSIPALGSSSITRPFCFSADGQTVIGFAEGRIRRWDIATGRELANTLLPTAKDFSVALLSDDGRVVAALNLDSSVARLWDTTSGMELRSINFDEQETIEGQESVALSPDGKLFAALTRSTRGSTKGLETKVQVSLWDVGTGKRSLTLKHKSSSVGLGQIPSQEFPGLRFSPDGAWLAVRDDQSLRIWEVASGRELKSLNASSGLGAQSDPTFATFASKFVFGPDKQTVSLINGGDKIDLFDTASTNKLRTLGGANGIILAMTYSPDGKLLASSVTDNQIKLWEVATGREVRSLRGAAMPISDIAFSPDGKSLTIVGQEGVTAWELASGGVRRAVSLEGDFDRISQNGLQQRGSSVSPDGHWVVASSGVQPVATIWDVASGGQQSVALSDGKQLGSAAFSADGKMLVLTEKNKQKDTANAVAKSAANATQNPSAAAAVVPDISKMMEMARKDPKKMQEEMKKVQDAMNKGDLTAGMEMMQSMGVFGSPINTGNNAATANSLRVIDVASGRELRRTPLPEGIMERFMSNSTFSSSALSFSPDGSVLASATGFGGPIKLLDMRTGQEIRQLKALLSMSVNTLAWSPDGKQLASAHWGFKRNPNDPGNDNFTFEDMTFSIKLWDPQTGTELKTLPGHHNIVNRLVFSPDSHTLASAGYDSTIKIWDLDSGRESRTLVGHTGSIAALAFSPDGKYLVSGSDDGSTRLWNPQTGKLLATLVSLNKGRDWLVVTPEGLFDGSPGGWNQILWRFSPAMFDVSPVEIFFNEYFHPGLLSDILAGTAVTAPVDISRKDRRQAKVTLDAPGAGEATVTARTIKVRINITEAPAGAKDLRLFRNGSLVKVWRGDVLQGQPSGTVETSVSLVAGVNELTAYVFNRDNVKSSDARLVLNGADSLRRPATFHLVAVGVNEYANPAYNLKYAAADAQAFAAEVVQEQRKLGKYAQFEVTSLLDRNATKANLIFALKRLAGSAEPIAAGMPEELTKISAAQPEDAVVVFFAGHGTAQQQRFYLIPHDIGYQGKRTELDEAGLREILAHGVSDLELEEALEGIDASTMLMVIDACNSGQALESEEKRRGPMNSKGLAQLAYEKGLYILTAAQSYQAALEAEQLGHGYLTYALIEEGLKTANADTMPVDGQVVLREWLDYATDRVPKMQEAKMRAARGLRVDIAFVEGEEKSEVDKRNVQRPRVFYRREPEAQPLIVAATK